MSASQKLRQRYIAFRVNKNLSKNRLEEIFSDLKEGLENSYTPWIVLYEKKAGEGLLKCSHLQVRELKNRIKNYEEMDIQILGVSGTIKKARRKFLSTE